MVWDPFILHVFEHQLIQVKRISGRGSTDLFGGT